MESTHRILIIDDDQEWCAELKEILMSENYSVDVAHDGLQGLNMVGEKDYHLMVLDLKIPTLNGFEVLERVKSGHPEIKVVVLTASLVVKKGFPPSPLINEFNSYPKEKAELADEIINKPFAVDVLLFNIKKLIGGPTCPTKY